MNAWRHARIAAAFAAFAAALAQGADTPAARTESAAARQALEAIPGRAPLRQRVRVLEEEGTALRGLAMEAGRVFYLKAAPGMPGEALCVREGLAGAERVLVDPRKRADGGADASIDWYAPSPDGRHVAFGLSRPGSPGAILHVLAVDDGHDLPLAIDRAAPNRRLAWDPDGKSFYYARVPEGEAGAGGAHARVYRHVLGRDTAQDEVVFAPGVGGARDVPEMVEPWVVVPRESRYAFAVARGAAGDGLVVHVALQKDLAAARPRWHELAGPSDGVVAVEAWRNDLYLLSQRDAPERRVLRVAANAESLAAARVVAPEGDAAIVAMALARDALYLRTMVAGVDRLERVRLGLLGTGSREFLKLPYDMAISEMVGDPRRNGMLLRLDGWTRPPEVAEVDARTGDVKNTGLLPPAPADFSAIDEVRLYAPAADGAKIPVTLLYRKSTRLTGDNPTLLAGYGAYGDPSSPVFDPARLAWLERGGVFAVAHVRGGGESGETWHRAGSGEAKATTVADFIAVCEFLQRYGFTNANRLAIEGTGAGAIPVGGALVRRPDLFAAAVLRDPIVDLPALAASASGRATLPEFGSAASEAGRERLREISPFLQVRDGMPYPAVLVSVHEADARADRAQAERMAHRLRAATTGGKPVLLRVEATRGDPAAMRAAHQDELADIYAFALWQLGERDFQPAPPRPPLAPAGEPPRRPAAPARD